MNQQPPPGWQPGPPPGYPQQGHPHYGQPGPGYSYPPQPPPKSGGISFGRIVIGVVVGSALLVAAFVIAPRETASVVTQAAVQGGAVLRSPQTLVDKDVVVGARGSQIATFSIPSTRRVLMKAEGRRDTGKGYSVYVMRSNQLQTFQSGQEYRGLNEEGVMNFSRTEEFGEGEYVLVVKNSENLLKSMTVHVQVVSDPR